MLFIKALASVRCLKNYKNSNVLNKTIGKTLDFKK